MRIFLLTGLLLLPFVDLDLRAGLVSGRKLDAKGGTYGYGSFEFSETFRGGERSKAILSGEQQKRPMGLYVYDALGNCVARDDKVSDTVSNDSAVEWWPAADGKYTVEMRNLGPMEVAFRYAISREER